MSNLNYIDLFAGAGGLSEGFIREGFNPVAHVEIDAAACYTLQTRQAYHYLKNSNNLKVYLKYLKGEINRNELYSKIPEEELNRVINLGIGDKNNKVIFSKIDTLLRGKQVDLIIGGPPCQAYSLVGRARSQNNMKGDPRNLLYKQYALYLQKYNPKIFVFENVLGLKSARKGQYLRNMEKLFLKHGYLMKLFTVDASNFGVLQKRKRIIIIGYNKDLNCELPDLEGYSQDLKYQVKEIFSDLPKLQAGEGVDKFASYKKKKSSYLEYYELRNGIDILTQHITRPQCDQDKKIYKIAVERWSEKKERLNYNELPENLKTHQNRHSFTDRFKVVAEDEFHSHTVVAHIAKDGHYYIHPDIEQNRSISVREAARLQSFPDNYYFEGIKEGANRTAAFKQIGNAVPPLLAATLANSISILFNGINP
jgi:DNA (cytosine-5)-methyltransferase 1